MAARVTYVPHRPATATATSSQRRRPTSAAAARRPNHGRQQQQQSRAARNPRPQSARARRGEQQQHQPRGSHHRRRSSNTNTNNSATYSYARPTTSTLQRVQQTHPLLLGQWPPPADGSQTAEFLASMSAHPPLSYAPAGPKPRRRSKRRATKHKRLSRDQAAARVQAVARGRSTRTSLLLGRSGGPACVRLQQVATCPLAAAVPPGCGPRRRAKAAYRAWQALQDAEGKAGRSCRLVVTVVWTKPAATTSPASLRIAAFDPFHSRQLPSLLFTHGMQLVARADEELSQEPIPALVSSLGCDLSGAMFDWCRSYASANGLHRMLRHVAQCVVVVGDRLALVLPNNRRSSSNSRYNVDAGDTTTTEALWPVQASPMLAVDAIAGSRASSPSAASQTPTASSVRGVDGPVVVSAAVGERHMLLLTRRYAPLCTVVCSHQYVSLTRSSQHSHCTQWRCPECWPRLCGPARLW